MVTLSKQKTGGRKMIVSKLKQYLASLEEQEFKRGRKAPNLSDIHRGSGVSYATISRLANNKSKRLDYATASRIISYMRSQGYKMRIGDIVEFEEVANEAKNGYNDRQPVRR